MIDLVKPRDRAPGKQGHRPDTFDVATEMPHTPNPETCMYVRMSTARTELSEATQIAQCEEYHRREGLPAMSPYIFVDEAVSGSKTMASRRMGGRLLKYLRRGDHLVVAAFDRFGRNMLDSITTMRGLVENGIFVHCLNLEFLSKADPNDPATRLILAQYAAFAEFEWNSAGRRFSTARMNALWSGKGNYEHSIPLFFERFVNRDGDGFAFKYRLNPRVFEMYDTIYQRYCEGWTRSQITDALNNAGILRPTRLNTRGDSVYSATRKKWTRKDVESAIKCVAECRKVNKWNPTDAKYTLGSD